MLHMQSGTVHILWDSSHIWGIMAWNAMLAAGINCRLVKAREIAHGGHLGKHDLLLCPGGSAKLKADALGARGIASLRQWISSGGAYLGFCGGAGLALTADGQDSLCICPWHRAGYSQRLYHMISGNVLAMAGERKIMPLPVWWPGRFADEKDTHVRILARYLAPGPDLWLADLPLARIPRRVMAMWKRGCGLDPASDFPKGQPLAVAGDFGQGRYILSYAHLETPESPAANAFLYELAGSMGKIAVPMAAAVPSWARDPETGSGNGNFFDKNSPESSLAKMLARLLELLRLGEELRLFFQRNSWLWGWRHGVPGMAFNNLLASLYMGASIRPSSQALRLWREQGRDFCLQMRLLLRQMETFLWNERMETTLRNAGQSAVMPEAGPSAAQIFGQPMPGGGLIESPLNFIEQLLYLSQGSQNHNS